MAINTHGGGARTNEFGLKFEQETSLSDALLSAVYSVSTDGTVSDGINVIGILAPKNKLYKRLLEPQGIEWKKHISKQLLPDEVFYNCTNNTVYIIEKKFQHGSGSVDEKLQTCDFKKKQYIKLFKNLGYAVEYLYVCNDWFKKKSYGDVVEYIKSVGCHIYFNEIPLDFLKLPPIPQEI